MFLDGAQEAPPNASPGVGVADVSFDDVSGQMVVSNGAFSGLIGTSSDAHVHGFSDPNVASGVLFPLTFTPGVTAGEFSGSGTIANIAGMMNNLTYINIHSSVFGGGEIRGQIIIPEPASSLLTLAATAMLAMTRRRRAS